MTNEFKITDKQVADAKQTFHLYDKKGQGKVATKDLASVFKALALHIDDDKLKEWADDADEDALGHLEWESFRLLFERKLREDEDERELREAFRVLDKERKGVIPTSDLRWILKSLGDDMSDSEIEEMIEATDTDGSGTVDYEEFKALMSN